MISWHDLTEINQLDNLIENSVNQPVILFKHSTRCPISSMAKNRLERNWPKGEIIDLYYLDLIRYREISNRIADVFQVEHQSPQILVIKNRKCAYDSSHSEIQADAVAIAVSAL